MGRVERIFSEWWVIPVVIFILLIASLMRYYVRSSRKGTELDLVDGPEEGELPRVGHHSAVHPHFRSVLDRVVLPLHAAHPGWERLDGTYDAGNKPVARFDWNGTVYELGSASHFAPLVATREWMRAHPDEDPLAIQPTKSGSSRLALRPEVGWTGPGKIEITSG